MFRVFFFWIMLGAGALCAQGKALEESLVKASMSELHTGGKPAKRRLLKFERRYARYNPLNYVGAGLMYAYQNVISEQVQAACMYEISCSEYTKLSIQRYGFFTGALRGFNQLSECFPGALYEHPPLFINQDKIVNRFEKQGE